MDAGSLRRRWTRAGLPTAFKWYDEDGFSCLLVFEEVNVTALWCVESSASEPNRFDCQCQAFNLPFQQCGRRYFTVNGMSLS